MIMLIVVGVLLLATIILSFFLSSSVDKTDDLKVDTTKRGLVERSLRDMIGQISSERDEAIADAQNLKIQVTEWQLKYYKCNRKDDHDCEAEISRNNILNAPDVYSSESGSSSILVKA